MAKISKNKTKEGTIVIEVSSIIEDMCKQIEADEDATAEEKKEIVKAFNKIEKIGKNIRRRKKSAREKKI
jgi:hypothetical protein